MPEVTVDELVLCPFSRHAVPQYVAARLKELDEDPPKKSADAEAEAAEEGAYFPLEMYVNDPDAFPPEGLKMMIKLAKSFYRLEEIFSGLESQISAAKSNPF